MRAGSTGPRVAADRLRPIQAIYGRAFHRQLITVIVEWIVEGSRPRPSTSTHNSLIGRRVFFFSGYFIILLFALELRNLEIRRAGSAADYPEAWRMRAPEAWALGPGVDRSAGTGDLQACVWCATHAQVAGYSICRKLEIYCNRQCAKSRQNGSKPTFYRPRQLASMLQVFCARKLSSPPACSLRSSCALVVPIQSAHPLPHSCLRV